MDTLTPDAEALAHSIAEGAAAAARNAFILGAHQGAGAFILSGQPTNLEEWRRAMLARFPDPSWKRSVIDFVPAVRFRPADIYTGRREDLEQRHRGAKNRSVSVHNALDALMNVDRAIVKTPDGRYAPAVDGVALPADAEDPTQSYRPRHTLDEHYARLLGYTFWTWSLFEWMVINLGGLLSPGFIERSGNKLSSEIAAEFRATVDTIAPRLRGDIAARLGALADRAIELVDLHDAFVFARPCTRNNGHPGVTYSGPSLRPGQTQIDWNEDALMQAAQAFEGAEDEANRLYYRAGIAEALAAPPPTGSKVDLELDGLAADEGRIVAATVKDAIERSLIPLIALGRVGARYGARPFAEALGQAGILDAADAAEVIRLAGEVESATFGAPAASLREAGPILEELWRLARSPGIVRRAIAHRARSADGAPAELPRPLPGEATPRVAVLTVGGTTISVAAGKLGTWDETEVLVDVDGRYHITVNAGAMVRTWGSRVLGNARAIELVPWLVDEPIVTPRSG